ncbi:hypothetical protein L6V77_07060 [Myxococcota bacterium]|nr:hypothetical protein [Myxococcota bacterium]
MSGEGSTPWTLPWAPLATNLAATYGLSPAVFREFMFFSVPGERGVYAAVAGAMHPQTRDDLLNLGWRALDAPWPEGRPLAGFLAIVGTDATRNVIDVDETTAAAFMRGEPLTCPPEADAPVLIVRRGRRVVGAVDGATGRALDA